MPETDTPDGEGYVRGEILTLEIWPKSSYFWVHYINLEDVIISRGLGNQLHICVEAVMTITS